MNQPAFSVRTAGEVQPLAYSIPDACKALGGMGRATMYEWFKAKKLQPRKMGRRTVILASDLQKLLENLPVKT
jgi:predicted DNA-binding transcriptional regulator AlpA